MLTKGRIKKIELIVTLNDEINASAWDDPSKPIIYLPMRMVLGTLVKLLNDYSEQKKSLEEYPFLQAAAGLTDYVPLIEFEEIIRFTLAHEATHIWLHRPGESIRKREIEADAWGIILSSQLSGAFKFRAGAAKAALAGGFSSNNSFEISMLCSKTGPDVLFYLYGKESIFNDSTDRESLEERKASIEQTYEKLLTDYMASLSAFDTITLNLSRILFSGQ